MNKKKLGKKIKLARIEANMTQVQLADAIKGKQKSVSRYERGIVLPDIETLEKICLVLKKSFDYFLNEQRDFEYDPKNWKFKDDLH